MSVVQTSHNLNTAASRRKNNCQKLRTFSPVILFHDHQYVKSGSGDLAHIHIPYGDPSKGAHLELHKKRVHDMLQINGKYWLDIIAWTREHPEPTQHQHYQSTPQRQTSPVPSLVSSSSPSPPYLRQHYQSTPAHYYQYKHCNTSAPPSPPADQPVRTTMNGSSKHMTAGDKSVQSMTPVPQDSTAKPTAATTTTSANNKRRRGNLPKAVTAILRDWLSRHKKHPYPTEEEKAALAAETNLNMNQISNWFINARRRILQPMLEKEEQEQDEHEATKNATSDNYHLHAPHNAYVNPAVMSPPYDSAYHHHHQNTLPSIYHHQHPQHAPHSPPYETAPTRRLSGRKRSAAEAVLTPTKYPPLKRMSNCSVTTVASRRRS